MFITIDDTTQPITEWAADYGIPVSLIRSRLRRGWNDERAITEPMVVRRGEKLEANAMIDEHAPPAPTPARTTKLLTYQGETLPVSVWADRLRISQFALYARLRKGWSVERALSQPKGLIPGATGQTYELNGECLTVTQWAARIGITGDTLRARLRNPEWTLEQALTMGDVRGRHRHLEPMAA